MHVAKIITRHGNASYTYYLLRQSYREGSKVKHRTLANLSSLPVPIIEAIRNGLAGEVLMPARQAFSIIKSRPHGHVSAVLGTARKLGLEALLDKRPSRERDLVMAMVVERVLQPASKLATSRLLDTTSLGDTLGVTGATEDELYAAMDWLLDRQAEIEGRLAERYLQPGGMALYDLTSVYVEGEHCELAKLGYSRDHKRGKAQIEFGLLTNAEGAPVAIEAFAGNTGDPETFQGQEKKVRERFGIGEVVWVADRGMLTGTQVEKLQQVIGAQWITALRAPSIRQLVEVGSVQLSLFDKQNLAEVTDPRYPGERLVVCYNPLLAERRTEKREDLLKATERELDKIVARVEHGKNCKRGGIRGAAKIGEKVGRVVNTYEMAKHFTWTITDSSFSYARNEQSIEEEAALDGLYVIRTNVPAERLDSAGVVLAYKSLAHVERAFRHFKLSDLEVRPIYHYREKRVRSHLLLCMLAYLVQREMQQSLAPMLFVDETPPHRPDPVAPSLRSAGAISKDRKHRTVDGFPVHSFRTLLATLGTVVKNRVIPQGASSEAAFDLLTEPTPQQQRIFDLLGVSPQTM
jgi:hypothetical protein